MTRPPSRWFASVLESMLQALRELGSMHMGLAGFPDEPPRPGVPPLPGHPERLCEPAALTEQERALARQLWP